MMTVKSRRRPSASSAPTEPVLPAIQPEGLPPVEPSAVEPPPAATAELPPVEPETMSLLTMADGLRARLAAIAPSEASDHCAVARDQLAHVVQILKQRDAFLNERGPR